MKTLFLDLKMGAAGDMLSAALLELVENKEEVIEEINKLNIPSVSVKAYPSSKCGIYGTHVEVLVDGVEEDEHLHDHHHHDHEHTHEHNHSHHHSSLKDIANIVDNLNVSDKVKNDVLAIYKIIAEAESKVHNTTIEEIHFHEVGTMDAVADITFVCMLMEKINPDRIVVSPVNTGSGFVRCAHGILPVPAPATAYILKGIPVYSNKIKSELCTPTGAAIIKHFADSFEEMPVIKTMAIGYGMGKKDFEVANCVRAILGESEDKTDDVIELSCNLDDMTAEAIGFASEILLEKGALDVYTAPIYMKKNRPAVKLTVMCKPESREEMVKLLFKHTTTIGIRENSFRRYTLDRTCIDTDTEFGRVSVKESSGYGVKRMKYEYEDLVRIAKEKDLSVNEVLDVLKKN